MEKAKSKRKHSEVKVVWWRFLGLWVFGAIVGWAFVYLIIPSGRFFYGNRISPLVILIIPGLSLSVTQALSLPRSVSGNPAWWFGTSLVGYWMIGFAYHLYAANDAIKDIFWSILFSCVCLFPFSVTSILVLSQWLMLHKSKVLGWLWVLLTTFVQFTLTASIVFIQSFFIGPPRDLLHSPYLWASILSALLSGILMLISINQSQHRVGN